MSAGAAQPAMRAPLGGSPPRPLATATTKGPGLCIIRPMAKRSVLRRVLIGLVVTLVVVVAGLAGLVMGLSKPRPGAQGGPAADELAHRIERAVDKDAWDRTQAVRWFFGGRHHHLWDRKRMYDRVQWNDVTVLLNLTSKTGQVQRGGSRVSGADERKLLDKAYAYWINDSYWLNPLVKLFDDGVTRKTVVQPDGSMALEISYGGVGLTPGDAYLWMLGPDGRPSGWQMWVSIVPLKGLHVAWDGWTRLSTGAWVSTEHKFQYLPVTLRLTELAGAATLAEIEPGPDPFAALQGP